MDLKPSGVPVKRKESPIGVIPDKKESFVLEDRDPYFKPTAGIQSEKKRDSVPLSNFPLDVGVRGLSDPSEVEGLVVELEKELLNARYPGIAANRALSLLTAVEKEIAKKPDAPKYAEVFLEMEDLKKVLKTHVKDAPSVPGLKVPAEYKEEIRDITSNYRRRRRSRRRGRRLRSRWGKKSETVSQTGSGREKYSSSPVSSTAFFNASFGVKRSFVKTNVRYAFFFLLRT